MNPNTQVQIRIAVLRSHIECQNEGRPFTALICRRRPVLHLHLHP